MDIFVEQMTDNTSKREQNSVVPAGCNCMFSPHAIQI